MQIPNQDLLAQLKAAGWTIVPDFDEDGLWLTLWPPEAELCLPAVTDAQIAAAVEKARPAEVQTRKKTTRENSRSSPRVCSHCAKRFQAKRCDAMFCSRSCRERAWRQGKSAPSSSVVASSPAGN